MSELAISQLRQQLRQEMRRYSAASIAEAALRLLWKEYPDRIEALHILPWNILLLVKWALRDEHTRIRIGRRVTDEEFARLRGGIQELVGKDYAAKKPPVHLMMRWHFPQFDFQRPEGWGFLRWPALVARQNANHPSRRQFVHELGLSPEHFMDLAFSLFAAMVDNRQIISRNFFDPLRLAYGDSIEVFMHVVALDLPALRRALQADHANEPLPLRQELYEFPHLKRYPFFRSQWRLRAVAADGGGSRPRRDRPLAVGAPW